MRKILFFLTLMFGLLVLTQSSFASDKTSTKKPKKEELSKKLKYGISLSPTISWLEVEHNNLQADGATLNAGAGIHFEYDIAKVFSIVSGINYQLNGGFAMDSVSLSDATTKSNFHIRYGVIDIPLMARIKTLPISNTIYYAQAGVSGGYRIAATEVHQPATKADSKVKTDIKGLINEAQFNSVFGLGAKFLVSKNYELFAEVNYRSSITEVESPPGYIKADKYSPYPVPHISSGNLVFSVGIQF